jgi:hypothetical protein
MIRLKHKALLEFLEGLLYSGSHQVGSHHLAGKPIQLVSDQDCVRSSLFAFSEELDAYELDFTQSRPDDSLLTEENTCLRVSLEALSTVEELSSCHRDTINQEATSPMESHPTHKAHMQVSQSQEEAQTAVEAVKDTYTSYLAAFQQFQSQFPFLPVFCFLYGLGKATRTNSFRTLTGNRDGKVHKATAIFRPLVKSHNCMSQALESSVGISLDGNSIHVDSLAQAVGIINEVNPLAVKERHAK